MSKEHLPLAMRLAKMPACRADLRLAANAETGRARIDALQVDGPPGVRQADPDIELQPDWRPERVAGQFAAKPRAMQRNACQPS